MKRIVLLASFLMLLPLAGVLHANDIEYITKVISQLDSYVDWAADKAFEGDGTKLVISAVGETDLVAAIQKLTRTESATGKTIKVRIVDKDMIPSNSHILLLDMTDPATVTRITDKLRGTGTLVISHGVGLASSGSSLNFVSDASGAKATMELNVETAKAEGLSIKPALLKLAKVVN
jgi:hypothetical protein